MYREGDSIGQIGLECIDNTTYEGQASSCGPNGTIVEEVQTFTCSNYCVQCGPRGRGAALCLSTPTTDRDCGEQDYFDNSPIICPGGEDPIPDTFCGRGVDRADCASDEFCFIEPADRFAVCCPYPENCCDPEAYEPSEWGSFCCSDGNWYPVDGSGGGNCNGEGLLASVACPAVESGENLGGNVTQVVGNMTPNAEPTVKPTGNVTEVDGNVTEVVKCCDPEAGPGGCPDENGSFDRCWDEGGFCCSDGKWYANSGAGGNNCQDNQLEDSQACVDSGGDDVAFVTDEPTAEPTAGPTLEPTAKPDDSTLADTSGGIMNIGGAATLFYSASFGVCLAVFVCM